MEIAPNYKPEQTRRLGFAEPALKSGEVARVCKNGILKYLIPITIALVTTTELVYFAYGRPSSSTAVMLLAICGLSLALAKTNHRQLAIDIYMVGIFSLASFASMPFNGANNGLSNGAMYALALYPMVAWVCYANRPRRILAIAATALAFLVVFLMGQPPTQEFILPDVMFMKTLVHSYLIMAVTLTVVSIFDQSVAGHQAKSNEALREQQDLNLQLANRQRDLEREANSHKRTLQHLTRSETRFRYLFNKGFDGIIIYDGDAEQPIEMNDAYINLVGFSKAELEVRSILELSPEKQADGRLSAEVRDEVIATVKREGSITYDWLHRTANNGIVDFEITTFVLPTEGNVRISVFRDLTEARISERKLIAANRELRTFAHAASHDLKEPLRTMKNFAQLIDVKYSKLLDDSGRYYLSFINDAASRGTTLVQDLLEYAELGNDTGDLALVDLSEVANTVKQTVAARLRDDKAEILIDPLPKVIATSTWAQQLLQNLISNALKFQRKGVPPRVHVYARSNRVGHEICVADNGIGIAPNDLERVFGVFERLVLREDYEGNGIGLALCRRIMDKVDGSISVTSTLGEGTVFTLSFPNHGILSEPIVANSNSVSCELSVATNS